jgi:hypothetical protein
MIRRLLRRYSEGPSFYIYKIEGKDIEKWKGETDKYMKCERYISIREDEKKNDMKNVMGWIFSQTDESQGKERLSDMGLIENPKFVEKLQEEMKSIANEDEGIAREATTYQSNYMPIVDERGIPPFGRIPDPENILGYVRVEDGKVVKDSYVPMMSYRLCNSDGLMQLSKTIYDRIMNSI